MLEEKINLARKLAECIVTCNYCISSCLEENDVRMMKECILLDKQCVEICQLTLGLLHKNSRFAKDMLSLCEQACMACAEECGKHSFEHCQRCAKACEECAKACNDFMNLLK